MSAVQDAAKERQREASSGWRWPWQPPLFDEPLSLIGYVTGVLACYLGFTGWEAASTSTTSGDITLFAALMSCGGICIEASARLGQPTGVVWRNLLSAWWLPVALLLPPLYALAAPAGLGLLSYIRVPHGSVYRRVFNAAALGLSGAVASSLFHQFVPVEQSVAGAWLIYPGPDAWLMRLQPATMAIACAVVFRVLNAGL